MNKILTQGKIEIKGKDHIAQIIQSCDTEDQIIDGTSPQSTSPILSTRTQTRGLAPRTDSGSDGNRNAATPLGQRFVYSHKRLLRRQLLMLKGSDRRSLYHGNAQYGHSLVIIS